MVLFVTCLLGLLLCYLWDFCCVVCDLFCGVVCGPSVALFASLFMPCLLYLCCVICEHFVVLFVDLFVPCLLRVLLCHL